MFKFQNRYDNYIRLFMLLFLSFLQCEDFIQQQCIDIFLRSLKLLAFLFIVLNDWYTYSYFVPFIFHLSSLYFSLRFSLWHVDAWFIHDVSFILFLNVVSNFPMVEIAGHPENSCTKSFRGSLSWSFAEIMRCRSFC